MKLTQTDIEAVARALCLHHGHDCDDIHMSTRQPRWMLYRQTARVALQCAAPVVLERAAERADDEATDPDGSKSFEGYADGWMDGCNTVADRIRALKDET